MSRKTKAKLKYEVWKDKSGYWKAAVIDPKSGSKFHLGQWHTKADAVRYAKAAVQP